MQRKIVIWLLIVGLFFLSVFVGLVSAQTPSQAIFDPVKEMFTSWLDGQLSINIAKYLITILVALIIYSTLDFFPPLKGEQKSFIRGLVSIIVAFLGIAYLNPGEIYTILASYTSLGFVLSAVFPFVILIFFSVQVHKDGGAGGRILSKVIWFGFIAFLAYKIIEGFSGASGGGIPTGMKIAYSIALGFAVLWMYFLEKQFVKMLFKEELEAHKDKLVNELAAQDIKRKAEAKSFEGGGGI